MSVVLTSPSVIAPASSVLLPVAKSLEALAASGVPVGVISNRAEPSWFSATFPSKAVQFVEWPGRQNGKIVSAVGNRYGIPSHDFIVLGASDDDVQMAKNGGAVLVSAGWGSVSAAASYGISVPDGAGFVEVVNLVAQWPGSWYFEGAEPWYTVRALADVSGKSVTTAQASWAADIVSTVKGGGLRLQALLTVGARSLLKSGIVGPSELMFGLYPSSASSNDDGEILSDFMHRLRTVTSRVRFAKKGAPLFVRYKVSTKRSHGGAIDRTDPSEQIESLHLSPTYRGKIGGRHVVLLDDCTTYGVSFGVASAFLRKAGALSVSCVALGKFGNQLRYYEIDLDSDPFIPISAGKYTVRVRRTFQGNHNGNAQAALRGLIK